MGQSFFLCLDLRCTPLREWSDEDDAGAFCDVQSFGIGAGGAFAALKPLFKGAGLLSNLFGRGRMSAVAGGGTSNAVMNRAYTYDVFNYDRAFDHRRTLD